MPRKREARAPDRFQLALWAIVAVALALRLWHIRHGLPDFLDEAIPLRRALALSDAVTGDIQWNPHFFHYPSLTIYLHLFLQRAVMQAGLVTGYFQGVPDYALRIWADPSLLAIPGRLLSVAFDVWMVWSVARIGESIRRGMGLLAASLLAVAATLILTSRLIYTDTVMAALAVAAFERMLAWRREGGRGRLAMAVVLIGLATGAKYPAALMLLPLAVVIALRELELGGGAAAIRRAAVRFGVCALGAVAVFLATTPFILFDWPTFVRDFSFVGRLGAEGHFGNYDRSGFMYHVRNLTRDFGWPGLVLLAASLPLAFVTWRERKEPALIVLALVVFGAPVAIARIEAERYLIPLLPFIALLIAYAAIAIASWVPAGARRPALAVLVAALVTPALVTGIRAGGSLGDFTRIEARRWFETHVSSDDIVVQELYAAPLLERMHVRHTRAGRVYASASPAARSAYDARRSFRSVVLPLTVVGMHWIPVIPRTGGEPVDVEIAPRPALFNEPVYDPRLFAGVDWVVTSSAVRGRFESDPDLYPAPLGFYALLDSTAERAARFESRGTNTGPDITVYHLTDRTRAAIAALGPLPPLWWTSFVEPSFRQRAEELMLPAEKRGREPMLAEGDVPAAWVQALRPVFESRYAPLTRPLVMELTEIGRHGPAQPLARATLASLPTDVEMAIFALRAGAGSGDWNAARRAAERTIRATPADHPILGGLLLEYAGLLERMGDGERARALLDSLRGSSDARVASAARERLAVP